jgi:hypothetical protein
MKKPQFQAGQSLIEFSLLLPILILLIMGLFDLGRAIFYYSVLNTAVREGTRFAIVQSDCDYRVNTGSCDGGYWESYPLNCDDAVSVANTAICSEVRNKLFDINELSSSVITIDHLTTAGGDPVISIDINFLFEPITPGVAMMTNMNINVHSQMLRTAIAIPQ